MKKQAKQVTYLKIFYFSLFFAPGSFFTLISVYLHEKVHLTPTQIGTVMSIGPILTIVLQPIWGIIADKTQNPRMLLNITLVASSLSGIVYFMANAYVAIIIAVIILFIPFSAANPLSDSITINFVKSTNLHYGNFRLWGAFGYSIAALIMGKLVELFSYSVTFLSFIVSLMIAVFFSLKLPNERSSKKIKIRSGIKKLMLYPKYSVFLLATFLTFGPMDANNVYLGLYIKDIGGTIAGVGLAWFLVAASEVPFMKFSGTLINKYGTLPVAIIAMITSAFRYILYFFSPSIQIVFLTTFIQGFSFAMFISAAIQYVQEITGNEMKNTAVAIYSAVAYGLGNWFFTLVGGIVYDHYSIFVMYLFFGITTLVGVGLFLVINSKMFNNISKSVISKQ